MTPKSYQEQSCCKAQTELALGPLTALHARHLVAGIPVTFPPGAADMVGVAQW